MMDEMVELYDLSTERIVRGNIRLQRIQDFIDEQKVIYDSED